MYTFLYAFLDDYYPKRSLNWCLKKFLLDRLEKIKEVSVFHLYRSLHPLGEWLNNPPITSIKYRHLTSYVDEVLWRRYSAGAIRPTVGDIKQFFRWCKKRGYTGKNVAKRLKKPKSEQGFKAAAEQDVLRVVRHLTEIVGRHIERDVFGNLVALSQQWNHADLLALRDLFIVAFLYETGCRGGELCHLGVRQMEHSVRVRSKKKPSMHVWRVTLVGKGRDRHMRYTQRTAEIWRLWQSLRPSHELAVFAWKRGFEPQPFTTHSLGQTLVRRCRAAGVMPFRSHALRHAKVKRTRQLYGLVIASRLVDHSTLAATRGYLNVDDDELATAAFNTGLPDIWGE